MTSLREALSLKWEGHSPESKLVYLKLVHQQLKSGEIVAGLVELAKSINVNKKTLSNAITDLKSKKLISTQKVNGKGINSGKKRVGFELLPLNIDSIFPDESLIAKLVESTLIVTKDRRTNSALLLLIIIITAKANEFGVVTDLPKSTIKQLAGITDSRLKSQLSKLMDMGVFRSVVSGLSGKYAFGKTCSYYFIDLNHKLIGINKNYQIMQLNALSYQNFLAGKIFLTYRKLKWRPETYKDIITIEGYPFEVDPDTQVFFKDKQAIIFARYFQTRIDELASTMLTRISKPNLEVMSITTDMVDKMFFPKHLQYKHKVNAKCIVHLTNLIQRLIIFYAEYVGEILNFAYKERNLQMRHMIIPTPLDTDATYLKVISISNNNEDDSIRRFTALTFDKLTMQLKFVEQPEHT